MPPVVTAIVVASDGAEYLRPTLDALATQRRPADRVVVAQLGGSPLTNDVIALTQPDHHIRVPARSGFGAAVAAGLARAGVPDGDDQWLWLLASDNQPAPDALEQLLVAVELAPSVQIAGPKQMQWDAPAYLSSYGETMTPFGTAVELAEPELDQAQYDRMSDVLAVAAGGMLVRASLWNTLEGFDPSLPAIDDALDFCVRARLAGHRVQLVPAARVRSAGVDAPGTRLLGVSTSPGRRARLAREAQLHRRLVYAPLAAVPLHWLSILPLGALRAAGQLLRKRPGLAPAELLAALVVVVLCFAPVYQARRRIARTRTASWKAVAGLRIPWREVRHRRSLLRDNGRPTRRRTPLHFVSGGGLATVVAVGAVSVIASWPLLGAPALAGGGLLPLGSLESLWGSVGWGWHPVGEGFWGPADPFALVLALLGSITFWHPSAAVVALWIAALPLAALGGWLAAAKFTRRAVLRAVGGILWAAAPMLLVALDDGRPGAVIVHLVAPFALLAAFRVRSSWTASATLALLGALMAACAPSLLPLLTGTWIAAIVLAATRAPKGTARLPRLLALPLPTLVLFLPLAAAQSRWGSPLGLLADPGVTQATAATPPLLGPFTLLLQAVAGWPEWRADAWGGLTAPLGLGAPESAAMVFALVAPTLVLAAVGLVWPRRSVPVRVGLVGVGGLVVAVLATRIEVGSIGPVPVPLWMGAALSLAWLGVIEAAVCGLDRLAAGGELPVRMSFAAHARAVSASLIGMAAAAAVVVAGSPLLGGALLGTAKVRASSGVTVPALVAAEAQGDPSLGLLTLTPQADGGVRQRLTRGGGQTLEQLSTLQTTADRGEGPGVVALAAALVQPTGDDIAAGLERLKVGYVLLTPGPAGAEDATAEAQAALGANPLFVSVSRTAGGTLYRYLDGPVGGAPPTGPGNTATPLGIGVLAVQGLVLVLTLLLALPTRRLATRVRPEPLLAAPRADVENTRAAAAQAARPAPVRPAVPARPASVPSAAAPPVLAPTDPAFDTTASLPLGRSRREARMREEVGAWR